MIAVAMVLCAGAMIVFYKKRVPEIAIDLKEFAGKAKFYYKGKLVDKTVVDGCLTEKIGIGKALFIEI